jgi:hypothetical protein
VRGVACIERGMRTADKPPAFAVGWLVPFARTASGLRASRLKYILQKMIRNGRTVNGKRLGRAEASASGQGLQYRLNGNRAAPHGNGGGQGIIGNVPYGNGGSPCFERTPDLSCKITLPRYPQTITIINNTPGGRFSAIDNIYAV